MEMIFRIAIFGFMLLSLMAIYSYMSKDDEDYEDTITITFKCSDVFAHKIDYTSQVIIECNKLRGFK
jgi:hypothetical protein